MRVEWQDEAEARGRHHIDVEMLDEAGRRVVGAQALVRWQGGSAALTIEDKPAPDYGANFAMYAAGCSYSLEALGLPSDKLECLGLGSIKERWRTIHTVFRVTFQRVTAGGPGSPSATPTATAPAGAWRIREWAVHPNCGLTRLMGVVQDAAERGLPGHRVEVTWEQPGAATYRTVTNSLGQWEIFLNNRPHSPGLPGWRVTAFNEAGRELVRGHVMTDATACAPGARNVIELAIEPVTAPPSATPTVAPPTATRVATATALPTPRPPAATATAPGYPAPATPSPIPPGELGAPVPVVWFDGALWSCPKATRGNGTLLMQCVPVEAGR